MTAPHLKAARVRLSLAPACAEALQEIARQGLNALYPDNAVVHRPTEQAHRAVLQLERAMRCASVGPSTEAAQ